MAKLIFSRSTRRPSANAGDCFCNMNICSLGPASHYTGAIKRPSDGNNFQLLLTQGQMGTDDLRSKRLISSLLSHRVSGVRGRDFPLASHKRLLGQNTGRINTCLMLKKSRVVPKKHMAPIVQEIAHPWKHVTPVSSTTGSGRPRASFEEQNPASMLHR